jgi:hypothetical protein
VLRPREATNACRAACDSIRLVAVSEAQRFAVGFGLAMAFLVLVLPANVFAQGGNDGVVRDLVETTLATEYKAKRYSIALVNLEAGKIGCEGNACSRKVLARVWIAIAMCQANLGQTKKAEVTFKRALALNPRARPGAAYVTPQVEKIFAGVSASKKTRAGSDCLAGAQRAKRRPFGWKSAKAYFCYRAAVKAEKEKRFDACYRDARHALELDERLGTRVVLARCLERDNHWRDAIDEWNELSRQAVRARSYRLARTAATRTRRLRRRLPVLVLERPKNVSKLVVRVDGVELDDAALGQERSYDPGPHTIEATGEREGLPVSFEQDVTLRPAKSLTIPLRLARGLPKWATQNELKCMLGAQSAEQFSKCLRKRRKQSSNLNVRVFAEASGYTDSMDVDVVTPSVGFQMENVTGGWGVGASFLVDVVTAASVDILATASPRWREVRWAPALNGHKKFGDFDVAINGSLSREPDYLATSVGGRMALDLRQKTITPSLGYEYSHDIVGRVGTTFEAFSRLIDRHAINAGLGLVLTKATFASLTFTAVFEEGDSSKPYRHIPVFDAVTAPSIPRGLDIDSVNVLRLPERPLEQLPTSRRRIALAGSAAHRFRKATLRLSQRGYTDSWGVWASTTDGRFMVDVLDGLRLWPHIRFHVQTAAEFYALAYAAEPDGGGGFRLPAVRTGDRELGPLWTFTGGAGARYDFGARKSWALTAAGDIIYTRFLDHLFALDRFGYFGALGLEVEFD